MSHSMCGCCSIIPSSMLRKLAMLDEFREQREQLLASADLAAFMRGQRAAVSEATLLPRMALSAQKHRDVFDAGGRNVLVGKLARAEGGPATPDPVINEAYDSTGTTWDFYFQVLRRNSIDGQGLPLESTVHSARAVNNAFWNGKRMVFGDATANGPFTGSFAATVDVVAHELAHGVTQYSVPGGLTYLEQPGALNESWSDVFGSLVKQWSLKQSASEADWLIGAGILKPRYGQALRSLKAPGTAWVQDDQPRSMGGYVQGGDVHTNSGIPNHAFYLAATALGGFAWDKAGPIWYRALGLMGAEAGFADAAHATIEAAGALFGASGSEAQAVTQAWQQVQVI